MKLFRLFRIPGLSAKGSLPLFNLLDSFLQSDKVLSMDTFIQHGDTSCLLHSVAVAYFSLLLIQLFRVRCDKHSLMRGALLHDYFLYDWHVADRSHRLHGFTHGRTALRNASADFTINPREAEIISRHMFPLTPIPPRCREGLIICFVDKLCSSYEVFARRPYPALRGKLNEAKLASLATH
ncbi:HD domain-containing protein [Acidaminobacterium chupaoyuni]